MKPKAIWKKCQGEAHKPEIAGHIDHCGVCMPYWEEYPVCSKCGRKIINDKTGWCKICKKYIDCSGDK